MGPGQPGIALGGLFYLLLALIGPVVEVVRALRGRSTAASRRLVARHFALAATMVVALDLTYRGIALLFASPGPATGDEGAAASTATPDGLVALPVTPILLGLALLAVVLAATKLADLGLNRSGSRRGRRRPLRALEATGD